MQLVRNPYARATLVRRNVPPAARKPCDWCGSRPGRFAYGWEDDRIYKPACRPGQRAFCSVACYRSYL